MISLELLALCGCWCFLVLRAIRYSLNDNYQFTDKSAALCVRPLDQYSLILVWAVCLGNWTYEDGWCGGQHI